MDLKHLRIQLDKLWLELNRTANAADHVQSHASNAQRIFAEVRRLLAEGEADGKS